MNLITKSLFFKQQNFKNKTLSSTFLKKTPIHRLNFSRNMSTNIDTSSLDHTDSENTTSLDPKITDSEDLAFRQWLAGLVDGDGYFLLSKNGYNSCEITMDARDKKVLYLIQHRYGGSVKQVSKAYAFKYKLRNRAGLIALINDVNGFIRNPTRLLQMNKLCLKFAIVCKESYF
jgi:hypothetical protein